MNSELDSLKKITLLVKHIGQFEYQYSVIVNYLRKSVNHHEICELPEVSSLSVSFLF